MAEALARLEQVKREGRALLPAVIDRLLTEHPERREALAAQLLGPDSFGDEIADYLKEH